MLLQAFATHYSEDLANAFISLAILTFCLSTQIGFFVYFETALVSLIGENLFAIVKWTYFLPGVIFAGITNVDQLWALANISVAASALPNLVALLMLSGVFLILMRDYLSGDYKYATCDIDVSKKHVKIADKADKEFS
jgi:AGCS family alanine or glycine:cation symporter